MLSEENSLVLVWQRDKLLQFMKDRHTMAHVVLALIGTAHVVLALIGTAHVVLALRGMAHGVLALIDMGHVVHSLIWHTWCCHS